MGRQRLRAHLRRLPPPGRARRRPARAALALHDRPGRLRSLLARLRPRHLVRDAHRVPGPPGNGRRHPLAVGLLHRLGHLPRGLRAEQGSGILGAIAGSGAAIGVLAEHPHRVRRLGMDLLRQRPDRPRSPGARPRYVQESHAGHDSPLRHRGRRHGHRQPDAPRLRPDPDDERGLGLGARSASWLDPPS